MKLCCSVGVEQERILLTDRRSSELIKYAANGFLATKIAYINEVAELCEKLDARIGDVTTGIGPDERIGARSRLRRILLQGCPRARQDGGRS